MKKLTQFFKRLRTKILFFTLKTIKVVSVARIFYVRFLLKIITKALKSNTNNSNEVFFCKEVNKNILRFKKNTEHNGN